MLQQQSRSHSIGKHTCKLTASFSANSNEGLSQPGRSTDALVAAAVKESAAAARRASAAFAYSSSSGVPAAKLNSGPLSVLVPEACPSRTGERVEAGFKVGDSSTVAAAAIAAAAAAAAEATAA
jgi:hypothetical protein